MALFIYLGMIAIISVIVILFSVFNRAREERSERRTASQVNLNEIIINNPTEPTNKQPIWNFNVTLDLKDNILASEDNKLYIHQNCTIQSNNGLIPNSKVGYFEIEVITLKGEANLCIGLARITNDLEKVKDSSIYLDGSTGKINVCGKTVEWFETSKIKEGDVIGCCYFPQTHKVIITKNGIDIATLNFSITNSLIYPTIFGTSGSFFSFNFGNLPFVWQKANIDFYHLNTKNVVMAPPPSYY